MTTRTLAALLACLLASSAAQANTWPLFSQRRGQAGYEVEGLPQTSILHETLTIDLTDVPGGGDARVEVFYRVAHEGEEIRAQLVFLPDTVEKRGISVTFDDGRVSVGDAQPFKSRWDLPATFPGLPGLPGHSDLISVQGTYSPLSGHSFDVDLTEGEHELRIEYAVEPGTLSFPRDPVEYHQLLYALAPARGWKAFGTLHVDVLVPPGWQINSEPPLDRDGDDLTGDFEGLPANYLALTFAPPNNYGTLDAANTSFGGAAFLLVIFVPVLLLKRRRLWALAAAGSAIGIRLLGAWIVPMLADDPTAIGEAFLFGMKDPMYNGLTLLVMGVPVCLVLAIVWLLIKRRARARTEDSLS